MIVNQELIKLVGSNTLFKGVTKDFLKSFIKPKNYFGIKEGTLIYSIGDESTDLYLIVEGEVKIKFSDKNKVEHRFITDFFGEDEILNGEKRTSHAIANNDCVLYKITADEVKELVRLNETLANNLSHKNGKEITGGETSVFMQASTDNADNNLYPGDGNPGIDLTGEFEDYRDYSDEKSNSNDRI